MIMEQLVELECMSNLFYMTGQSKIHLYIRKVTTCAVNQIVFGRGRYSNLYFSYRTIFFSLALQPQFGPWHTSMKLSVSFRFFLDLRHSVGLLGRVISSSQGLYLYTNTENSTHEHQTSMPWVVFEPKIQASE
jgi:hypothetical protein